LDGKLPKDRLKNALAKFMIMLPVYRLYPAKFPLREIEIEIVKKVIDEGIHKEPALHEEFNLIRQLFEDPEPGSPKGRDKLRFIRRLMQFTGPLTAKGVEDTTFYVYNPLISHNEVGDSPSQPSIDIETFHRQMQDRLAKEPLTMNSTSTHDTKRGEDARMRINLLSQIPDRWKSLIKEWMKMNQPLKKTINGKTAPSVNDEYFLYQSLIGGFPQDLKVEESYIKRLQEYMVKVLREAKIESGWDEPNEEYEKACTEFIASILNKKHDFLDSLTKFLNEILDASSTYSLNQALIKITAPGIPDIYQGCELWDL